MPFPMKIQPVDSHEVEPAKPPPPPPVVVKSRLKRLFERPFMKNAATEKVVNGEENAFEPSSVCLAKMVQNFIDENNEKQTALTNAVRCGRNRCNCFNGNGTDSSEDELDNAVGEACEILKGLVLCASVGERNLLADTAKIVDKNNKICKRKDDNYMQVVTDGLVGLGYDASICKSRWDKSPSRPAGEYEYIDVIMVGGERLLIDIDFKSVFEIARPTKAYKCLLQILPHIFVGSADRLGKIVCLVSEAAKQSLKKKGMPIPPWRKAEYVKAKWLSSHVRTTPPAADSKAVKEPSFGDEEKRNSVEEIDSVFAISSEGSAEEEEELMVVKEWKPPELKPKSLQIGVKIVAGLASIIEDEP